MSGGDTIFHQGDYGHEMYIVISGRLACKFERKDANLKPIKDRILKPGDYFGELAAFDLQNKRTCTILATAFSEIYTLSREDMYQQFARQPHVMDRMRTAALEHARETYLDIYGSKKEIQELDQDRRWLEIWETVTCGRRLSGEEKLDLNKEETDGSVEENKSEEAEGKRVLSLFNRKGDAAKEKLEKQAAEGHERACHHRKFAENGRFRWNTGVFYRACLVHLAPRVEETTAAGTLTMWPALGRAWMR